MMSFNPTLAIPVPGTSVSLKPARIESIDALRGVIMFAMIFVNDLAGVSPEIVPWWMRHFPANGNGMTFVDLVFPGFLFVAGMSIPIALNSRLSKAEPAWQVLLHVVTRTLSLLFIGILMVNGTPDSASMGWSGDLWSTLMYLSAIITFCSISTPGYMSSSKPSSSRKYVAIVRLLGFALLILLAFMFRGKDGHRIITLAPFSIHTSWYGILGLIGWAYLVASLVFLVFRAHCTALLGCMVLLMCLYPASKTGAFDAFWLNQYVGLGSTLGSQAAITVGGVLLGSILVSQNAITIPSRPLFTILFVAGCSAGALLLHGLYGINKNSATPSWCLWACAITALLWLVFHLLCDVGGLDILAKPLTLAGANVFLAYLLSEMLPSALNLFHLESWYSELAEPALAQAITRSASCALVILATTVGLNYLGLRLKL